MKTELYDIEGMHCAACSSAIERVTRKLNGVARSEVNLPMNRLSISYDETLVTAQQIVAKIQKAGFGACLHQDTAAQKSKADANVQSAHQAAALRAEKLQLVVSVVASVLLLYLSMGQMLFENLPVPDIFSMHTHPVNFAMAQMLLTILVLFLERCFFVRGFTALFHANPNMDTLVAISAATSFGYSLVMTFFISDNSHAVHQLYYESAAIVLALVSVGKYLEGKNKEKTKEAIAKMMQLTPAVAILVDENGQWEVPTEHLKVGDVVLVKAGQSVPLDGTVVKGAGSINEAMLTGESLPVEKQVGSDAIGGSIATSGALYVKITKIGEDTTLAKIVKFVEEAQGKKAPISKLADRIAGVFVPVVIAIALGSALVWLALGQELAFALKIFTSVLVIACPCSMGLATPTSIIVGTGLGASNGILMRSGEALETTHNTTVAIFDKTGTITSGSPVVTDVFSATLPEPDFLRLVISLEKLSAHPLAQAICAEETNRALGAVPPFEGAYQTIDGRGIVATGTDDTCFAIGNVQLMQEIGVSVAQDVYAQLQAQGKTVLFVACAGKLIGYLALADTVKPDAKQTIALLRKMQIKTVLLTGDNARAAQFIGDAVGVDEIIADVLPTEKAQVVQRYQAQGAVVMMVGDGINDAPALVQADVGCAIGNGSDIAIDAAQVILLKNQLADVAKAIRLSQHTIVNIKQNLFWAFCYNCLCIPIAAGVLYLPFGILLSPMIGGFAMSLSSLFVVGNALRLKTKKLS